MDRALVVSDLLEVCLARHWKNYLFHFVVVPSLVPTDASLWLPDLLVESPGWLVNRAENRNWILEAERFDLPFAERESQGAARQID